MAARDPDACLDDMPARGAFDAPSSDNLYLSLATGRGGASGWPLLALLLIALRRRYAPR